MAVYSREQRFADHFATMTTTFDQGSDSTLGKHRCDTAD